jgi:hypothetical protein
LGFLARESFCTVTFSFQDASRGPDLHLHGSRDNRNLELLSVSIRVYLGYDNFLCCHFCNWRCKLTSHYFREVNASAKSVYSICALWMPHGDRPSRLPVNRALSHHRQRAQGNKWSLKPWTPHGYNRWSKRPPSILKQTAVRRTAFSPTRLNILASTVVTATWSLSRELRWTA